MNFIRRSLGEKTKVFLLYVLVVFAIYAQVVFLGKSLLPNLYYPPQLAPLGYEGRSPVNIFNIDLATPAFYEQPINLLAGKMYLKWGFPLWNPYQGSGTPLAAQYSTRVFFPYQILEDISPVGLWDYFILGRLIIAAFFTYLFLRLLNLSLPCAFLGGIFYGLSGSFTWFINLEQFTNVAMMVPICLFSLERTVQFKKKRYLAESAIVLAFMFLAGQPEIAIYVMLLAVLYYFFRVAIEKPKVILFLKEIFKFGGIVLLGLGLSAFLILPFLELIPNSYQCHPLGGTMGVQEPASLAVAISILIPSFFELPTHYRIFPHNGVWDWLGGYTGILMFFLTILGFFYKGKYRKPFLFFSLFAFFIILKNFGFPIISWIGRFPLLDQSWSQRWAGPVWTFSIAVAAAIGLETTCESTHKKKFPPWIILFFLLSVIIFLADKTTYFSQIKNLNSEQLKVALPPLLGGIAVGGSVLFASLYLILHCQKKKGLIYGIIFLGLSELWFSIPKGAQFPWTAFKLIPFLFGIFVAFSLAKEKWRLSIAGIILVALSYAFIDLKSPYGFPDRYNIFKEPEYVKFLKKDSGFSRIVAGEGILMPNFSSGFELFDIRYINSLSPLHYQNYVDRHLLKEPHAWITDRLWFTGVADIHKSKPRLLYQEMDENLQYYSYLGVKYILAPSYISLNLPLVYNEKVKIYENPSALPRVYIARNVKIVSDYKEAQELMKGLDIRDTVIIEQQLPAGYKFSAERGVNSWAKIRGYSPHQVKISAHVESDSVLVLTDVFYPGWKCYVDNKETQVYRINGLVRGVFLKEGSHSIIFKYLPFSFKIGLTISAIAFILCLTLIFI